jgi:hypothetical protein
MDCLNIHKDTSKCYFIFRKNLCLKSLFSFLDETVKQQNDRFSSIKRQVEKVCLVNLCDTIFDICSKIPNFYDGVLSPKKMIDSLFPELFKILKKSNKFVK